MTTPVVTNWKKEWFEIEDAAYLNTAAHTVMPRVSVPARSSMRSKRRSFPIVWTISCGFEASVRIRASLSQMIGAKPEEIALTSGASAGVAAVAHGLEWKQGDEIITAQGESPLHYASWKAMEKREGVTLKKKSQRRRAGRQRVMSPSNSSRRCTVLCTT